MGPWLLSASDAIVAWIAAASLRAVPLGLAVAIVDRLMGPRTWPQFRAALWWLVIVAVALPPGIASPVSVWGVADPGRVAERWVARPADNGVCIGNDFWCSMLCEHAPGEYARRGTGRSRFVMWIWLVGLTGAAAAALWRSRSVRREWLAARSEPTEAWFDRLVVDAARRVGLRRAPIVRVQADAPGAALIGVWRPAVVIPAQLLESASVEQVRHVLMHELAHVRRRDAIWSMVCTVVQVVYWFHPLVRLARSRLETLREICCDQAVVASLRGRQGAYRRTLLELARAMVEPNRIAPLGFVQHHSQIMARLTQLQRPTPGRPRLVGAAALLTFALLLAFCLPRARAGTSGAAAVPGWSKLPGCLQLQYAVLRAMAEQDAHSANPELAYQANERPERRDVQ